MSQLSRCIFKWDAQDLNLLKEANKGELIQAGLPDTSSSVVSNSLTKEELSRHCRMKTRGHEETVKEIEALLLALSPATDVHELLLEERHSKPLACGKNRSSMCPVFRITWFSVVHCHRPSHQRSEA